MISLCYGSDVRLSPLRRYVRSSTRTGVTPSTSRDMGQLPDEKASMLIVSNPKANPEKLVELVQHAAAGRVVLPDFQRDFVWESDDVRELLVSVLHGYFIGTFLMLDTSSADPMFPIMAVAGCASVGPSSYAIVRLVLDGQQRITALHYALHEPSVPLKGSKYPSRFYIDVEKALDEGFEDAILVISDNNKNRIKEAERKVVEERFIRVKDLLNSSNFISRVYSTQKRWTSSSDKEFLRGIHDRIHNFMVPVVALDASTGVENIVAIFERINRTGVNLSLFDLIHARLYQKSVRLRDLWEEFQKVAAPLARDLKPESILRVMCLLGGRDPRKRNLLGLPARLTGGEFVRDWEVACHGMQVASQRARDTYGAMSTRYLPYSTILPPLAVLLTGMEKEGCAQDAYRKLDTWYWAAVFSQRYDHSSDSKSQVDVEQVREWIKGSTAPEWIVRVSVASIDLTVEEQQSAIFRGLLCLALRSGCRDFWNGQVVTDNLDITQPEASQIDHVFPKSTHAKGNRVETVANRVTISGATNKKKSAQKPSQFMAECLAGHGDSENALLLTLDSHLITESAYLGLLDDNFEQFVVERQARFRQELERLLYVPLEEKPASAVLGELHSSSGGPFSLITLAAGARTLAQGRTPETVEIDGASFRVASWRDLAGVIVTRLAEKAVLPVPFSGGESKRCFLARAPQHPDGSKMAEHRLLDTQQGSLYLHVVSCQRSGGALGWDSRHARPAAPAPGRKVDCPRRRKCDSLTVWNSPPR